MKIGLVGLARSGKTSLFNLLTGSRVVTSSFGASRGEVHTGVARVPDERLTRLGELFQRKKTTAASFEVVDLAGITKGERRGLDAKEFRSADALLHVVRAFPDEGGTAPAPRADVADLEAELILADLEVLERRLERLEASLKRKRTDAEAREQAILLRIKSELEAERPIRTLDLPAEEEKAIRSFTFLSQKPILHCLNLDEKEIARAGSLGEILAVSDLALGPRARVGWVSALIEAEVAQLAGPERDAFLADLGLRGPAVTRVLKDCYALLGLISFFTVSEDEVRAWSVPSGTHAQDAAGAVHSDMARGFIRAEVVGYEELIAADGSWAALRERGQLRLEGKDYVVRDGEICHFRFNIGK